MRAKRAKEPWIHCARHGIVKGYAICKHLYQWDGIRKCYVRTPQAIEMVLPPSETRLGYIRCAREHVAGYSDLMSAPMCEECARIELLVGLEHGTALAAKETPEVKIIGENKLKLQERKLN